VKNALFAPFAGLLVLGHEDATAAGRAIDQGAFHVVRHDEQALGLLDVVAKPGHVGIGEKVGEGHARLGHQVALLRSSARAGADPVQASSGKNRARMMRQNLR